MKDKGVFIGIIIFLAIVVGASIWGVVTQGNTSNEQAPAVSVTTQNGQTATGTVGQDINLGTKNFMHKITLQTNFGAIEFETYDADAPKTVENFVTLANKGFYNGLTFHRVIKNFMIQGGDPKGDGTGGPGYEFADELNSNTVSYKQGYVKGVVAMANAGPNTNGSQFFIMLNDTPLPHDYTIFGKVVAGQDVVDAIGNVKTDSGDKPLSPVVIEKATVSNL